MQYLMAFGFLLSHGTGATGFFRRVLGLTHEALHTVLRGMWVEAQEANCKVRVRLGDTLSAACWKFRHVEQGDHDLYAFVVS